MEILVSRDGEQFGPYGPNDARKYLAAGRLQADDWAWHQGADGWISLKELLASIPPEVPALPPLPLPTPHFDQTPAVAVVQSVQSVQVREDLSPMQAARGLLADLHDDHSFFGPVFFPFRYKGWLKKMWWIPILNYIPGINLILLRGWRLDYTRRIARDEENPLPGFDLAQFFLSGSLLWCMTGLYSLVPIAMIAFFGVGGFGDLISDLGYFWDLLFTDKEVMPLGKFVVNEFRETLAALAIDSAWIVASFPLYRAAMVRYAVTGKLRSFLNVWGNGRFILKNPLKFAQVYMFSTVIIFLLSVGSSLLIATVVGAFLVPILVPGLYYWSTASEFGLLARHLVETECLPIQAARNQAGGVPERLPMSAAY